MLRVDRVRLLELMLTQKVIKPLHPAILLMPRVLKLLLAVKELIQKVI